MQHDCGSVNCGSKLLLSYTCYYGSKLLLSYQANISIDNKQIQQVNKSKALGTIVDQHLFWKPDTENICKKIGTRSVHVGSFSEVSQDLCTSVIIVTMLN